MEVLPASNTPPADGRILGAAPAILNLEQPRTGGHVCVQHTTSWWSNTWSSSSHSQPRAASEWRSCLRPTLQRQHLERIQSASQGSLEMEMMFASNPPMADGLTPVSLHLEQPRNGGYTESAFNPLPAADNDLILVWEEAWWPEAWWPYRLLNRTSKAVDKSF